jgi:AraC family transcriptional regulator of adaptative response / methylphosphotriester-DNA alkyltransferase methyltransferase
MPTDQEWLAIENNDATFDGQFWYAVKTTRIFCRPSCPSRLPKREHIEIYQDPFQAEKQGFRPCKRCRPLNEIVSNEIWAKEIGDILLKNYQQNITLESLAAEVHGSESYLRHIFKEITGLTPQQKLLEIRLDAAKEKLLNTNEPIKNIAQSIGIDNSAYFISRFRKTFGITPRQFRYQNR